MQIHRFWQRGRRLGWGVVGAIAPIALLTPANAAIAPQPGATSPARLALSQAAPIAVSAQGPTTFEWLTGDNQQPGDPSAGGSRGNNGEGISRDRWASWVEQLSASLTGERVGEACVLVPTDGVAKVASDRPFWVVQGDLPSVGLYPEGGSTPVWQSPGGGAGVSGWAIARYPSTAPSLARNTPYRWVWASGAMSVALLNASDQATLDQNLLTLFGELDLAGASADRSAYERSRLYGEAGLWLDAVQVLLLVPDPSPELEQAREQLLERVCS